MSQTISDLLAERQELKQRIQRLQERVGQTKRYRDFWKRRALRKAA